MVKCVLISPPEQHVLVEAGDRPNLGLLYLAGSLNRNGHECEISDLNHDSYKQLKDKLRDCDFIGMTTHTPYFEWVNNFSAHLKQNYPDKKLIAGGPHATVNPESLIHFDYIVQGEGEQAIIDIVEGRVENRIIKKPYIEDLDTLPIPHRNWSEDYSMQQEGNKTITLLTSRSCPFNCCFCTKGILGKYRYHSVNRVIQEIKEMKEKGFSSFYFIDDHFTFNRERAIEICNRIIDEKLNITFRCTSRTDKVDYELITKMKEAGLRSISLGLEHFDDNVLKKINKGETMKDHINAINICQGLGIVIRGSFIVNLPGAAKETIYRTLDMAIQMNLDYADFYPLIAYPGTPIWENPEKFNAKIIKDSSAYQTGNNTNVIINNLDAADVREILSDVRQKWKQFKGRLCPWESK